jgi:hypothetical protein
MTAAPICGYFGLPVASEKPGVVVSDGHEADVQGGIILSFFIPLPNGCGARVFVCEPHARVLEQMYGPQAGMSREDKGKLVRQVWVKWAEEQPVMKESWSATWEQMPERDREADRRIGERLYAAGRNLE